MDNQQKIDKEKFKQIFRDNFAEFQKQNLRYNNDYHTEVIEKMLGCAEKDSGYAKYRCMHCGEERIVPFSCKSSFCLSCARIKLEQWLAKVEDILFDEVDYRHVILTVPEALRKYFYNRPQKLDKLIKCGIEMLKELMSEIQGEEIEFGYIVVLQTAGRSAQYNPHLHIMMTAGGLDKQDNWHDIDYVPFNYFHKKWQYFLFKMMREEFGSRIKSLIDDLYRKYPDGIVAHIKMEKVPKKEKLANYLMKYVGSPPIALSRILNYDGENVKYWYKDHRTDKKVVEEVSVITFIGRMVQHILPKGFQRVRYYGLHATCKAKKVAAKLKDIFNTAVNFARKVVNKVQEIYKSYRERIKELTGDDPFICPNCGEEMILWEIWVPGHGKIYDELEEIRSGKYDPIEFEENSEGRDTGRDGPPLYGRDNILQLSLW